MLGRQLIASLSAAGGPGPQSVGLDRAALDITEPDAVRTAIAQYRPDVVINCAAFTAVDSAETREAQALRVNGAGPANLAAACADQGARLIHISTDYVFRGTARSPYFEDDQPCPGTAYGRTKLAGERAVLSRMPESAAIVRTAWLYTPHGSNFVRTMAELAARAQPVDVVYDQTGSPTSVVDVARCVISLGPRPEATGIFHATNTGEATRYDLATQVFRLIGADPSLVHPISARQLARQAPRPAYTVLGHRRWPEFAIEPPRDWRSALHDTLREFPRLRHQEPRAQPPSDRR